MNHQEMQLRVLNAIPLGKENAIIADKIQEAAGTELEWRTQLPTRDVIRKLRCNGHAICSTPALGYWITKEPRELLKTIEQLNSRTRSIQHVSDCLLETYQSMGGVKQKEIF